MPGQYTHYRADEVIYIYKVSDEDGEITFASPQFPGWLYKDDGAWAESILNADIENEPESLLDYEIHGYQLFGDILEYDDIISVLDEHHGMLVNTGYLWNTGGGWNALEDIVEPVD